MSYSSTTPSAATSRPSPLNLLALTNSIAAYALLHSQVPDVGMDDPRVVEQEPFGDTDYYLITAPRLPLLMLSASSRHSRPDLGGRGRADAGDDRGDLRPREESG